MRERIRINGKIKTENSGKQKKKRMQNEKELHWKKTGRLKLNEKSGEDFLKRRKEIEKMTGKERTKKQERKNEDD